jgi:hypothetical protein
LLKKINPGSYFQGARGSVYGENPSIGMRKKESAGC